mgnify:CR=1 FL=1
MRRPALLLSLLLFFMISSYGQKNEVRFLIDTTISIMRENSVNASKVDWVKVKQEAAEKANGIESPYELGPVMRYLFQSVDDFHGSFFLQRQCIQLAEAGKYSL